MKNKFPQISATIYDGNLKISYKCPGLCTYALYGTMPLDGSEECVYRDLFYCRRSLAQSAALKDLKHAVARAAKRLAKDVEEY